MAGSLTFAADIDVPEGALLPTNFEIGDNDVYVEISDGGVNALTLEDSYEDSIGMTDEEALQLYNKYLASLPEPANASDSVKYLNGFADYAVEQGIIADTVEQCGAITKAVVRASFKQL